MATVAKPSQVGMQELLADLTRRIRRLEQPQFISLGNYRITQDPEGNLIVKHVPSNTITTLAEPPIPTP